MFEFLDHINLSNQTIFWLAFAILVIASLLGVYNINRAEVCDTVGVPKHISVWMANKASAQQVYDWVVYVTRMTGLDYLQQLNWPEDAKHAFLFGDLRTVLHMPTEEMRLDRFREIGRMHQLKTDVVDQAI